MGYSLKLFVGNSATKPQQLEQWCNSDNRSFYLSVGVAGLELRAKQCGLIECPDLETLRVLLAQHFNRKHPSRIIEIGAGYGRVARWCSNNFPHAQLTLIESCPATASELRTIFGEKEKVSVIEDSILTAPLPKQHDLALWLWAGFLDFTKAEKQQSLKIISKSLATYGLVAIEIPRTVGKDVEVDADGNMKLLINNRYWHGQVPTESDIKEMASSAGLFFMTALYYETSTKLKRIIYILQKPESA